MSHIAEKSLDLQEAFLCAVNCKIKTANTVNKIDLLAKDKRPINITYPTIFLICVSY